MYFSFYSQAFGCSFNSNSNNGGWQMGKKHCDRKVNCNSIGKHKIIHNKKMENETVFFLIGEWIVNVVNIQFVACVKCFY